MAERVQQHRGLLLLVLLAVVGVAHAAPDAVNERDFGAWTLRCEGAAQARRCIMLQNLVLGDSGQTVLQFTIGFAPGDPAPTVLLSLPLGIALPPGVSIRIDAGAPATFPIERCEPAGCRAGMKLRERTVAQLADGRELVITFFDADRQPIDVPVSLGGFADGYAALQRESAD